MSKFLEIKHNEIRLAKSVIFYLQHQFNNGFKIVFLGGSYPSLTVRRWQGLIPHKVGFILATLVI